MENLRGATAPISRIKVSAKVKTFVLDTNVLLHDPQSVFKFEENNLAIPVEVLEELDAIKGEQSTERGRNARRVHRILQELLPDARAMHEGVELDNGGTLSIIINPYLIDTTRRSPAMDRLRIVQQNVRVQHEGLDLGRYLDPRNWGRGPARVFHQGGVDILCRSVSNSPGGCR